MIKSQHKISTVHTYIQTLDTLESASRYLQTNSINWYDEWYESRLWFVKTRPLSSDRQHLSYDGCLEVRGEIIRTVLCCIVYWSCAQSRAGITVSRALFWKMWGPSTEAADRICHFCHFSKTGDFFAHALSFSFGGRPFFRHAKKYLSFCGAPFCGGACSAEHADMPKSAAGTVISTLRRAVLTVLWIGFCHTGHISLCVHSLVFISVYLCVFCVFILHMCCIIVSTVECTWWDWSLILSTYLHCWLGYLTRKNSSLIWPIMCLVGR